MTPPTKTPDPTLPAVRRLLKISGRLGNWLYLALFFDLLLAVITVLDSNFLRYAFDGALAGNAEQFWLFALLTLGLTIPGALFAYLQTASIGRFGERTLARLRQAVAARIPMLPVSYLEGRHSGDMLSVLNADLDKVKGLLASNLLELFGQVARWLLAFTYILSISWSLTLISTILTPVIFILINLLTQPIAKRSEEMQDEIGQVNSVAQDALGGAMVVKAFNLADLLDGRFRQANAKAVDKGLGIARLWGIVNGAGLGLSITPFIIAFGFGGYLIIDGQMTFGSLFAFINLLNYVVNPLGNIPRIMAAIGEATGAAQRVFAILDQPDERQSGAVTQSGAGSIESIELSDVSFAYTAGSPVLNEVGLTIGKGQTVALVGPSGGGKSTVLKLILGFYPLPDGRLKLFGSDMNAWQLAAARQQMAFVSQETYLFPVSLAENIRCGRPEATQAEIEAAARQANIHDFIASLPDGYNTPAGEWGARLSGGQKQRIALARAILKDAPILLLDEPTSALDTESEAAIQDALERFTRHRTTVVVAHRLSTIKNADRVLVLADGKIIEDGSHDELIARGGVYLDLYQRQFALDQPAQN
jgi:subfamily B ATP-binding cassette protein MsbA/ATP-binding cassette subfamily B protein AbcA/BmrA